MSEVKDQVKGKKIAVCEGCTASLGACCKPRSRKRTPGPMNGYQYFQHVNIPALHKEQPEVKGTDCMKAVSAQWKLLTDEQKATWKAQAKEVYVPKE